jgi:hypothetical protein
MEMLRAIVAFSLSMSNKVGYFVNFCGDDPCNTISSASPRTLTVLPSIRYAGWPAPCRGLRGSEITVEGASRRWSHACGGVQRHLVGQIAFGPDDIGTLALLDESPREASEDERIGWEPLRTRSPIAGPATRFPGPVPAAEILPVAR